MKSALVTGGAGFIGSHLCEDLLGRNYKVTCLDNLYTGSKKNISSLLKDKNFRFIKGDVLNKSLVQKLVKQADTIYHLAAVVGVEEVMRNPVENISVNTGGIINVAECTFKYDKRVVFASSSEVYGKNSIAPLEEDKSESIFGSTSINRWAYGHAKAIGEHVLYGYAEMGLRMTIVRYFNSYGPRSKNPRYANVIPKFIRQAIDNKNITVYGNGQQTRCFCYVKDTARGTILAGESDKSLSQVINIGSDKEITIKRLAEEIIKLTSSKSKIEYIKEDRVFDKKFESSNRRVPSIKKAKKLLGFSPKLTLREGLQQTIVWYQ